MTARLVDAQAVAAYLGVERDWVYAHAAILQARRLGTGPKARLRFSLEEVDAALTCSDERTPAQADARYGAGPGISRFYEMTETSSPFNHSTPALYDRYMGPLLFEPYARLIAERLVLLRPTRILETAAGTGIVTRAANEAVPQAEIVATDLNPVMLEFARQSLRSEQVDFQKADAQDLPFADGSFDLVVCQFGVMFFPAKVGANRQAWRVLGSGGRYLLVSFDQLENNPVPKAAQDAVAELFPDDPPEYMERGPFSYADPAMIEHDLRMAGFTDIQVETVASSSRVSARDAAQGLVLGSPFRAEIERRDPSGLGRALEAVTEALRPWDGKDAPISAHVVTASKS